MAMEELRRAVVQVKISNFAFHRCHTTPRS